MGAGGFRIILAAFRLNLIGRFTPLAFARDAPFLILALRVPMAFLARGLTRLLTDLRDFDLPLVRVLRTAIQSSPAELPRHPT